MAYNHEIEARVREIVSEWDQVTFRKMFGGVVAMHNGNMLCGILDDFLILRIGQEAARAALEAPHVYPFDRNGRPMRAWVMVASEGFQDDATLNEWLRQAASFVAALPPK
ncbi:MAG: TfoX/Sxy family protein [Anaerolineae bacterium]|nr:TfoX/Sxy family protein [Anaerolineae bacterium]